MYNKLAQEVKSCRKWYEPIHHNEAYKTAKLYKASVFVYIDLKIYISLIALYIAIPDPIAKMMVEL